jgi:NAD(P)-dependent dehydrogenase (short-subunit alcohol dehydrogenase family)
MRGVAQDAGPYGVTSNAVLPGWVRTEMAEVSAREEAERRGIDAEQIWTERAATYPIGRVVTPQEVAETVLFLLSDGAGFITGVALPVDGGRLA